MLDIPRSVHGREAESTQGDVVSHDFVLAEERKGGGLSCREVGLTLSIHHQGVILRGSSGVVCVCGGVTPLRAVGTTGVIHLGNWLSLGSRVSKSTFET